MRRFSFASGSSALPPLVRAALSRDVENWRGSGFSALELPFTGQAFAEILGAVEDNLRALLDLPHSYRILFLQGGASAQFALMPMNLLGRASHCDYVQSGYWSRRAIEEAAACCDVRVIATGSDTHLPPPGAWRQSADAAYCHFTSNETANGLQFHVFPEPGDAPLVSDMTADFLTRPIPIERFGLIYASAQKNLGSAGLTIVVVRDDLLGRARPGTPAPFDYTRQAAARSKVNTPPTFPILVACRMLRWLLENGGLEAAAERNRRKSGKLYAAIDRSSFYFCPVSPPDRSLINICFRLPEARLEALFLEEAEANGLFHLRGHAMVGGLRASLYNPTPEAAVDALVSFMVRFEQRRG